MTADRFCELPGKRSLCYRSHGPETAPAVILIVGLGLQLIYWPEALIAGLVERGLRVITLDNRDSGRSFFTEVTPPTTLQQFFRKPTAGYDLGDMADDVIGLMDGLRLGAAHVVGMSMGGMIAQTLAARYPQRVMSLASIFSTTGSLRVGQPAFKTILQLLRRPPGTSRRAFATMWRSCVPSVRRWNGTSRPIATTPCKPGNEAAGKRATSGWRGRSAPSSTRATERRNSSEFAATRWSSMLRKTSWSPPAEASPRRRPFPGHAWCCCREWGMTSPPA